jgi:membrane protease subunit HflK
MSWQNNNDGGRGPWGQGGGKNPNDPPNIDDLIRQGKEKFFGGSKGGEGKGGFFILIIVAVLVWMATGIYKVGPDEEGVVVRFGKYVETTKSGLHYHLPTPLESVFTPKITKVNEIEIGGASRNSVGRRSGSRSQMNQERQMLTGDENIIDVGFSIFWRISDSKDYLFNLQKGAVSIKAVAESAMREVVAKSKVQDIMTSRRNSIELEVKDILQQVLDGYQAGVLITQIKMNEVAPPVQVQEAFKDVQKAEADHDKTISQAMQRQNEIVPQARGQAERKIQEAEAYKARVIAEAVGQAARFTSVLKEYQKAKEVTRRRLYIETMEEVLGGANKTIIDSKRNGVVPYLPLNQLQKKN